MSVLRYTHNRVRSTCRHHSFLENLLTGRVCVCTCLALCLDCVEHNSELYCLRNHRLLCLKQYAQNAKFDPVICVNVYSYGKWLQLPSGDLVDDWICRSLSRHIDPTPSAQEQHEYWLLFVEHRLLCRQAMRRARIHTVTNKHRLQAVLLLPTRLLDRLRMARKRTMITPRKILAWFLVKHCFTPSTIFIHFLVVFIDCSQMFLDFYCFWNDSHWCSMISMEFNAAPSKTWLEKCCAPQDVAPDPD